MSSLNFIFKTRITFSGKVNTHHFLLRIKPFDNETQQLSTFNYAISPQGNTSWGKDTFGNAVLTGYLDGPHNYFEFESSGAIESQTYQIREPLNPVYKYPSELTQPTPIIRELYEHTPIETSDSVHEQVACLSQKIQQAVQYQSGVTTIHTTADEALAKGKGVCQDYAHILIALCRLTHIPARYIAGFMEGEGSSHAWIEYYTDDCWFGFDPTHNKSIQSGYIKLAQGRDYNDCPIEKGVFRGTGQQQLEVYLKVQKND
jgi:transglutaminase-like putative cysteine protease